MSLVLHIQLRHTCHISFNFSCFIGLLMGKYMPNSMCVRSYFVTNGMNTRSKEADGDWRSLNHSTSKEDQFHNLSFTIVRK